MRRMLAALLGTGLALILLAGCAPAGLWRYPRPASVEEPESQPELLTVVLPQEADQILQDAMELLVAKAKDISGGQLLVQVTLAEDPLALYREGAAEAVVLTMDQAAQLEPQLEWLRLPFLFPSWENLLIALSDPEGPVMDGSLDQTMKGEVLGIYYGGSWGLGARSTLYLEEVGLEGMGTLGVAEELPGQEMLRELGAANLVSGSLEEQIQQFDKKELRALEIPLCGESLPQELKCFYPTRHRIDTHWLILQEDTQLSGKGKEYLRQAVSYTIASQNQARTAAEEEWLTFLETLGVEIRSPEADTVFDAGMKYIRDLYKEQPEPFQRMWEKLLPAMQG